MFSPWHWLVHVILVLKSTYNGALYWPFDIVMGKLLRELFSVLVKLNNKYVMSVSQWFISLLRDCGVFSSISVGCLFVFMCEWFYRILFNIDLHSWQFREFDIGHSFCMVDKCKTLLLFQLMRHWWVILGYPVHFRTLLSNFEYQSCIKYSDINSKHLRIEMIYQEEFAKLLLPRE